MPCRFHALVEIRQYRLTPGEPPRDPNQSSASPVIDYKRLTPGEAKEMHPLSKLTGLQAIFCKIQYSDQTWVFAMSLGRC